MCLFVFFKNFKYVKDTMFCFVYLTLILYLTLYLWGAVLSEKNNLNLI